MIFYETGHVTGNNFVRKIVGAAQPQEGQLLS